MARKAPAPIEERLERQDLDLFQTLAALDAKNYDFYAGLSDEQQRKFVPYMLAHWMSQVRGSGLLQRYYLASVNETANRHLFDERVQHHPQLQWLMLCASSPGLGRQPHAWVPHLNARYARLQQRLTAKEARDYLDKIYKQDSESVRKELAAHMSSQQQHCYRLAQLYPNMKREDVELLAQHVTGQELDEREEHSGL
jgi:hypothetical protein